MLAEKKAKVLSSWKRNFKRDIIFCNGKYFGLFVSEISWINLSKFLLPPLPLHSLFCVKKNDEKTTFLTIIHDNLIIFYVQCDDGNEISISRCLTKYRMKRWNVWPRMYFYVLQWALFEFLKIILLRDMGFFLLQEKRERKTNTESFIRNTRGSNWKRSSTPANISQFVGKLN